MQTSQISALPGSCAFPGARTESPTSAGAVASPTNAFGSSRQAIMRVVAAQVLSALGDAGGARMRGGPDHHRALGPAGAVAQALKAGVAQGADPQSLLSKVQDGIENAQAALADKGFDPAQVAAAASQFTDQVARLMDSPSASSAPPEDALAASVQISRKERGSLVLTTQDGDVLRIRFRNSERQSLEVASVNTSDAQAASVQLSSSQHSRTRVEVEGTLDAGEMKAIEDFVGQVDALASEFFDGDVEAAFGAAASLNYDAGEIAGFSLKLSMSESVKASAVQRTSAGPGNALGMTAPTAQSVSAPVASAAPSVASATASSATSTGALAPSDPAPAAPNAASDPLQTVLDFVQRTLKTADAPLSIGGFKLAWSAKVRLAAEVVSVAAPTTAQQPGVALLSNVLDKAAAQAGADAPQVKVAEAA